MDLFSTYPRYHFCTSLKLPFIIVCLLILAFIISHVDVVTLVPVTALFTHNYFLILFNLSLSREISLIYLPKNARGLDGPKGSSRVIKEFMFYIKEAIILSLNVFHCTLLSVHKLFLKPCYLL